MRPERLVYLCDWLPPDFGAVGQYAVQFARQWAEKGIDVSLYGLSASADSVGFERHGAGALKIVRMKSPVYARGRLRQRAWWTLTTNVRLLLRAWVDIRCSDTVLFTGSPPFLVHFIGPLNVLLRKRLIYRITDFHPECWMAMRERSPLALRLVYRLTVFWRRRVDLFEVLGEDQRRRLREIGIPDSRMVMKRDPCPAVITPRTRALALPALLAGRRVLLYSGNFGVPHDYETFLAAYVEHHRAGAGTVALWLNATGTNADRLEAAMRDARVPFHRSRPVPIEQLAQLLVAPHAHLVTLKPAFAGYVVPSKVYGCIESARDILYIGPAASDVHLLCESKPTTGRYFHAECGDVAAVIAALGQIGRAPLARRGEEERSGSSTYLESSS